MGERKKKAKEAKLERICIWGTGNTSLLYEKSLEREGIIPEYYIDNSKEKRYQKLSERQIEILSPEDIEKKYSKEEQKELLILVCSANPEISIVILHQITGMGLKGMNMDAFLFKKNKKKIAKVLDLLEDERSKKVYNAVIEARKNNFEIAEELVSRDQYFCIRPFLRRKEKEVFVDCGAYVGDSFETYMNVKCGVFQKAFLFEPDSRNYAAMEQRLKRINAEWGMPLEKVQLVFAGVGRESTQLAFSTKSKAGTSLGAKFGNEKGNEEKLPIYALDDFFVEQKISFLKADIESYEYDMLLGAEKTIKRDKPLIAVCIYHGGADLYDIPLLLHRMVPEYKFQVRHHTYEYCDTVLYAYME